MDGIALYLRRIIYDFDVAIHLINPVSLQVLVRFGLLGGHGLVSADIKELYILALLFSDKFEPVPTLLEYCARQRAAFRGAGPSAPMFALWNASRSQVSTGLSLVPFGTLVAPLERAAFLE